MKEADFKYREEVENFSNILRHAQDFHYTHKGNAYSSHWDCPICVLKDILESNLTIEIK